MTGKALRRLSRKDLLELLLAQGKELQTLREQYAAAQSALEDRRIRLERAGSIAEAALQLSGIFDAAQSACQQYTQSLAQLAQEQEALRSQAQQSADRLLAETKQQCEDMLWRTQLQCAAMLSRAQTPSSDPPTDDHTAAAG